MAQVNYLSSAITSLRQQFSQHPEVARLACKGLGLNLQQVLSSHYDLPQLVQAATQALRLRPDLQEVKEALATVLSYEKDIEEETELTNAPLSSTKPGRVPSTAAAREAQSEETSAGLCPLYRPLGARGKESEGTGSGAGQKSPALCHCEEAAQQTRRNWQIAAQSPQRGGKNEERNL